MSVHTTRATEMFRDWERHQAIIDRLGKASDDMALREARMVEEVIRDLTGEQAVTEQIMAETLDGAPEAALCKLRVALENAKVAGVDDSSWDLVRSALGDLQVAVTPPQIVY